jgi:hypothetical protein
MLFFSNGEEHWAVFPCREIAITAAAGACRRDVGGYSNVQVHPVSDAPLDAKRYEGATNWLFEGADTWSEPIEETGPAAIVRRCMRELARRIASHPQELAIVEWRDLERILFEAFDALGYRSSLTRPGKDGGYDLRLEAEGFVYFVEIKHWSKRSKVGAGIVDHFTEIVIANAAEGLLLSTSGFTEDVVRGRIKISEYPVVLGNEVKVISLCRYYVLAQAGLWIPEHGLREIFFEGSF